MKSSHTILLVAFQAIQSRVSLLSMLILLATAVHASPERDLRHAATRGRLDRMRQLIDAGKK